MANTEMQKHLTPSPKARNEAGPKGKKQRSGGGTIKQGLSGGKTLKRTTFRTDRQVDFFNEQELVTQRPRSVRGSRRNTPITEVQFDRHCPALHYSLSSHCHVKRQTVLHSVADLQIWLCPQAVAAKGVTSETR